MPDQHLLTGAYVLDALDDIERAGFERHLRTCPDCSLEVADFREVAIGLAERVAAVPPPALRGRVLAQVARTRQVSATSRRFPLPSLRRTLASAAAAVLVAAAAGLGGIAWQGHRAADQAQTEAARIARVMTDPGRIQVVGTPAGGGTATVVASGGSAVFAADGLRTLPDNRTYQVWLIDPTGVRSAGLLKLRDGAGQALVSGVRTGASVAVSVEPDGGSKQPTTKPILNLQVT